MSTLSILMILGLATATVLSKVTQIGLQTNHQKSARQMTLRLSRQFRHDIGAASNITLADDGSSLTLQIDSDTITYVARTNPVAVDRKAQPSADQKSDAVADNQAKPATDQAKPLASAERYGLPLQCEPQFSQTDDIVSLRLTSPSQRSKWIIQAVKP